MPTLIIKTNIEVPADAKKGFLKAASALVAAELSKPESVGFFN